MIDFIGIRVGAARALRRDYRSDVTGPAVGSQGAGLALGVAGRQLLRRAVLRPMVVMAARVMGPGPARLRMVKLAHRLSAGRLTVVTSEEAGERFETTPVQPTTRAA